MIKRVLAGILLIISLTWASPGIGAAHAEDAYVAPAQVSVSPAVIAAGGRSTITFSPGFFQPGEKVAASISGRNPSAAVLTGGGGLRALTSDHQGGMTAVFVAPQHGRGVYAVKFSASRGYTAYITVISPREVSWDMSAHAPQAPSIGTPAPAPGSSPEAETPDANVDAGQAHSLPDREGRVEIPGNAPNAPDWPKLDEVPWSILLLAIIALIVTSVTGTLLIAARRRR